MKMRIEYRAGLVTSLARPEGNITGNTFLGPELGPLQLLERGRPPNKRRRSASASCVYSERTMQNMLTAIERQAVLTPAWRLTQNAQRGFTNNLMDQVGISWMDRTERHIAQQTF